MRVKSKSTRRYVIHHFDQSLSTLLTDYQDPDAFERAYAAIAAPVVPEVSARPAPVELSDGEAVDDFTTVTKSGKAMQFTAEGIFKNLQIVQEARGKKVIKKITSF